ncbi:probable salivary secreted peptide [Rhodnius prolixus]|uniref:Putative similat to triatoma putative salivary secreted protein n=1 Tax=Rhodnius prolixus TaxID=13249 RepID=R4G7T4_RHOPR
MHPYRSIWFTILVVGVSTIVLTSARICKETMYPSYLGKRAPHDKLLYSTRMTHKWSLLGFIEEFLEYPVNRKNKKKITAIEVLDLYTDGNGGCFAIIDGGVGYDHVAIYFLSQFMRGFDFIVKIYG